MVFNSYAFAVFLPIVLLVYWRLGLRGQNRLIVVASYVFYGWWDWRFLGVMWFTTALDFVVGRAMGATTEERRRRMLLTTSLIVNLGALALFKYFDFFVESATSVLESIGFHADPPTLRLVLPIGISFYTFHGISYTVDVYRRKVQPVDDPVLFAAFVAYFPQLVAGPIGRAEIQLPQIANPRERPDRNQVSAALVTILVGFAKKVVVADGLAPYITETFGSPGNRSSLSLLLAAYAFALQIYGDFSGYTDIARGVSRLLGIELLENFRQPYLSASITEFWQRWHISLSSWLRDYLYIPLGGNQHGRRRTLVNLFLTMLIGGLWHGAAWTFVVWGALHGLFLVVGRLRAERPGRFHPPHLVSVLITFHLVVFGWIFFRADSLDAAWEVVRGIAAIRGGAVNWSLAALLVLSAALLAVFDLGQLRTRRDDALRTWRPVLQGSFVGVVAVLLVLFSGGAGETFIYFKF